MTTQPDPFDPKPDDLLTIENCEARLMQFVMWVLKHSWKGQGVDGGEAQDKAAELGIITCVPFHPNLHTDPEGEASKGDDWFVYSQPLDKYTKLDWQFGPANTAKFGLRLEQAKRVPGLSQHPEMLKAAERHIARQQTTKKKDKDNG